MTLDQHDNAYREGESPTTVPHSQSHAEPDSHSTQRTRPEHGQVAGELLWLDPAVLEQARNRPEKPIAPEVEASITEHGNLVPLVVVRTEEGRYAVWDGWHRVILLRKTSHMARCAVYPLDTSAEQLELEAARIALQFNTGAHRYSQSEIDRADAVAQMLDLGLSDKQTRQQLVGVTSKEIAAVKTVTRSATARQALYDSDLDLVQAAAVAEHFADDLDAVNELIEAAARGQFDHHLQHLLDARAEAAAEAATAAAYSAAAHRFEKAGIAVLEPGDAEDAVLLDELLDADGNTPTPQSVPTEHLAVVLVRQAVVEGTEERIPVDLIDLRTEMYPDDEPDPGMYHVAAVTLLDDFAPDYYCTDPEALGLVHARLDDEPANAADHAEEVEDPAELAERRARQALQARQAAEAEQARREEEAQRRAQVTELNRRARAATKVRRAWLAKHLFGGQKTVSAGSWELIGRVIAHPDLLTGHHTSGLVADLGKKVPNSASSTGVKARDNHGALRALLRVVAAVEAHLQPVHERPDYYRRADSLMADYLRFLDGLGYPLAPVERLVTGDFTTAQVLGEAPLGPDTPGPEDSRATTDGVSGDPAPEILGDDTEETGTDPLEPAA
ncbi:ParB N-terminal domain-containing protein [Nocardia farcinica]|uniref:ParB N-terminal domain-containing protein n=1 Tax=Nocardia farcinica TaxID=37329 RepID=UPI001894A90C|nr:ParB N-terminal domain-containing protein [Nocardia farcinica]MBF6188897.1 ParB N-terminal domain-containing protein [Nocardia farcinica]MBF6410466.1 ParB N-terminal domain-containing protein [Nocardia farcinica]